jgi:maltose alpha-D-glucosyltransferase / alpha-amylase
VKESGTDPTELTEAPLWYKDAVIYELHIRAFLDSDGDGIGDFRGLTRKLDYLRDLGVTAVWILPFMPSPLRDDGYDTSDYTSILPAYGTLRDFRRFLKEAHKRDLRVITELVLNHTSDQHPWFQRARRARPGSRWRDFYVWSDTPDRYRDARIIFKDFESSNWSWDPVAKAYYWHRFYSHQPDLNYDNPHVRKAVIRVLDFWLGMGVDGFRLDAVPYLFEREGTNCENLPETLDFLRQLRSHIDGKYRDRVLLAEANQWPEDAVAYFGEGDVCHMAYHFPLMPRLFMALRMEDRFPVIDILEQTPSIPDNCQWALFLRNHDELTLEMVTDEERDYMYRVYAQDPQMRINLGIRRRLAPLLGNHRRRIELMNGLLLSLPGSPVIYYGDEIGMGDNVYLGDRNGVRTPMQWSSDRNAGFSPANPQQLYLPVIIDPEYHFNAVNVEAQQNNSSSLLWWTRRLIAQRRRFAAFGRGDIEFLHPENRKILAFVRRFEDEIVLVVANLSRFVQCVDLDLSDFEGMVPVEVFGETEFPPVADRPYFLSIGPHSFYWLQLVRPSEREAPIDATTFLARLRVLSARRQWMDIFDGPSKDALQSVLARYLPTRRWFGGKARSVKSARVRDALRLPGGSDAGIIVLAEVSYTEGDGDTYLLPLAFASGQRAQSLLEGNQHSVVARLRVEDGGEEGILYEALAEPGFCGLLLDTMSQRRSRASAGGRLRVFATRALRRIRDEAPESLEPAPIRAEQSNTSVVYGERLILKLFRRLEPGVNPDLEIGRFLTEKGFPHVPQVVGALEYRPGGDESTTLAVLHEYVANEGDAWAYTVDRVAHFFEKAMAAGAGIESTVPRPAHLLEIAQKEAPPGLSRSIGNYIETARLLGRRTAELHLALASEPDDPRFSPEPFSKLYQRSLFQSMRSLTARVFRTLHASVGRLPEETRPRASDLLPRERSVIELFRRITGEKIAAKRLRCHGDYHLGQVLYTGRDFAIMDFEGEPARPVSERRIKRSPLRDVAGMIRSFHYAVYSVLLSLDDRGLVRNEDRAPMDQWADDWYGWVSAAFLRSYLESAEPGGFLPETPGELRVLLDALLLEKAIYELGYELNNRPGWVRIPLKGVEQLLGSDGG